MGFEPTTASLEGWNSTTELRPPLLEFSAEFVFRLCTLSTQCFSLACVCSLWWAGKDSNLGSRWQQIYSLPPLATWVPALNTCTQNPKRSIILAVSFVRMMKNEEQASPRTAPPSL